MYDIDKWPGSIVAKFGLVAEIGKFLRTHRHGDMRLITWLRSIPPDHTEEEYQQEHQRIAAENDAARQQALDEYNARRAAEGLPPIDRKGNVIANV